MINIIGAQYIMNKKIIAINSHIFVNKIFLFQTDGENKVAGVALQHNKSRNKRGQNRESTAALGTSS